MKLIYSAASPFVRKVRVMSEEAGLSEKIELISVKTTALARDQQAVDANPLGKIPALIIDEETTLFDSRVICRYLDDLGAAGLYAQENLWDILTLEALADGLLEAAVLMVYEARLRPQETRSEAWVEAQWHKISDALDALNERRFKALEAPLNFAQLCVGCALGYLDFRHDARNWRARREWLAKWNDDIQNRRSLMITGPSDP